MKKRIYSSCIVMLLLSAVALNSYALCKCILDCSHCAIETAQVETDCCASNNVDTTIQYLHSVCCEQSIPEHQTIDLVEMKEDRELEMEDEQIKKIVVQDLKNPFLQAQTNIRGSPDSVNITDNAKLYKRYCSFLC